MIDYRNQITETRLQRTEKNKTKYFSNVVFWFLCFGFWFLIAVSAFADTVYLVSGDTIKGLVVEEHHDRIVLSTYTGQLDIFKVTIEEIFFDNQEQNYAYLADRAAETKDFERAFGLYQKARQINHNYLKIDSAFSRLIDAQNREKFKIASGNVLSTLEKQLGISIQRHKDKIRVVKLSAASGAGKEGIGPGDYITGVWDASIMFMDTKEAAGLMVGLGGTPLVLTVEKQIILPSGDASWITPPNIPAGSVRYKIITWFKKLVNMAQFKDFGFSLSLTPAGLTVKNIGADGAAFKNGLRAADIVTHINRESTRYMPAQLVKRQIFQSRLKDVELTVRRQVTLVRK